MDSFFTGKYKQYVLTALLIAGVYFALKYLCPLLAPFLLAFLIVSAAYPRLERLQKKIHIKKTFLTAGLLFLICLFGGTALWGLGVWAFHKLGDLIGGIDVYENQLLAFLHGCCSGIEQGLGLSDGEIENFVVENVNIFIENLQIQVVPKLMDSTMGWVKNLAGVGSFLFILIIASILLTRDYPAIMEKIRGREELNGILEVCKGVFAYIKTYLKAQTAILLIISLLCAVALCFAGVNGGVAIGLFAGFMDMLPFIGTGIVLLPTAFLQILNGSYAKAAVVVILYACCALIREFLEPRLIGKKVGIYPVAILLAVYAGIKLFGLAGVIKGPLGLVIIYEACLRLWKKTEKPQADA